MGVSGRDHAACIEHSNGSFVISKYLLVNLYGVAAETLFSVKI
jgi:hypothetical protein